MHKSGRHFRGDSSASAAVVSFMVGAAIFLGAVGTILVTTQREADPAGDGVSDAATGIAAENLAAILVDSSGVWSADIDNLARLGLMAGNGSGIDPDALEALRGAMAVSTANDKVDYPDALESLGLDPAGSAGFHLRVYPVGLDDLSIDPDTSVGFIADWDELGRVTISQPAVTAEQVAVKANVEFNRSMIAESLYERRALRALGVDYVDRVYVDSHTPEIFVDLPLLDKDVFDVLPTLTLLEGDVYPDDEDYLEDILPGRLGLYDVVVVGSGVDHKHLNDHGIRLALTPWVQGGGTLIVLGSADQQTTWLQDLLNVGVSTVNGAAVAPDIAHPLLKEPNDLDWIAYDTHDLGWDIQENGAVAAYDDFSHVVLQDGEDILAVSKMGAYGDGRIILSSFQARDIAATIEQEEAEAFLENMITYADRSSLYLDYGGEVPADQPVALAIRQSWVWDEVYGNVPVRVEVLTWG